ncbi:MAG: tRNA (guanosine(37)-N1)-methyltransferase TrmD [Candidatus Omnitrophica bacterium]|nr:tRNA (guanosine(37)-N1)-methyltransferase TrmD [Candidatus Omnitrophota bacterium]MBU4478786.1 tRNA (guanosine(37)-N1)-methyltransferase TrmD [Candidatus Omnitrophota bacterium]
MKIDVLTLFPAVFDGIFGESILKRAQEKKKVSINVHNLRDWTHDKRRTVDDKPFGGGPGMVIKPEPVYEACDDLCNKKTHIILLTPQGEPFCQDTAQELISYKHILLICGHYEGFDERIRKLAHREISVGDYILTGGEIPAMVVIDAVTRLIPGVLGEEGSLHTETFTDNLLEYPHYTRPRVFRKMRVPQILLSGDHQKIEKWRKQQSLKRTREKRKDLLDK